MTKPMMDCQWKVSKPSHTDIAQMITVLEVSMVERWAAEAYLVVVMPQTLKMAIDDIIPSESQMIVLSAPICLKAYAEFSR